MAVNSSWDVQKYRSRFEPTCHWKLKEEFMLAHQQHIEEEQLVCLANVYMNMQILGCHYPSKLASQVQKLSKNIGDSYKQQRDSKLSRYFVKASDAATAKIRRTDAPTSRSTVEDDHAAPVNYDSLGNYSKLNLKTKKREKQSSDTYQTDVDVVQVEQKIKKKKKAKSPILKPDCDEKLSQEIIEDVNETPNNDVYNPECKEKEKKKKNKSSSTECNENDTDCVEVVAVIPSTKKTKKTNKLNAVNSNSSNVPSVEVNETAERKRKRKAGLEEEFEDPSNSAVEVESPSRETKKIKKKKRKLEIERIEDESPPNKPNGKQNLNLQVNSELPLNQEFPLTIPQKKKKVLISFPEVENPELKRVLAGRPLHKFFRRQDRAATLILQSMAMNQNGSVGCGYQVKCVGRQNIAYVNNVEVARRPFRSHENKSVALEMLARDALVIMSKYCPLLLQKKRSCETNVESDDLIGKKIGKNSGESEPQLDEDEQSALSRPISSSNVGSRLLQLMGWTGGGLGKNETGRVDPVEAAMRHGRSGLGFKDSISQMATKPIFKAKIENLLRQFKREFEAGCAEREELVFPSVFSKDQRALVHSVAQRLSLKSVSYGSGEARYLVVKPKITQQWRVQQILENGGENELYKVYPAGTYDLSVLDLLD